jgi:hypothetical protein
MPAVQHPRFSNQIGPNTTLQAASASTVTPSDSNELAYITSALYVGGSGTVSVVLRDDSAPVSFTVAAGTILPLYVKQVRVSGTSATNIIALY